MRVLPSPVRGPISRPPPTQRLATKEMKRTHWTKCWGQRRDILALTKYICRCYISNCPIKKNVTYQSAGFDWLPISASHQIFSPAAPSFDAPQDFISEPLFNPSRSAYFCKKCAEILQCMANSIWFMNVLKNMAEIFLPTPLSIDSSASESKGLWFRIVSWCCDPSSSNSNSSHTLWSVPSSPGP